jgi:peptide/nickel transport system substrate-binding protein
MRGETGIAAYFAALFFAGGLPGLRAACPPSYWCCPGDETDYLEVSGRTGERDGTLIVSERSEPKTFNPLIAIDGVSREIIGLMTADLIHINRSTQRTEPALAKSWTVSQDGRRYTLHLRRGLHFSDGHPFDADDVVFTFRAYLDQRIHAPQRDFLIIRGRPISVQRLDPYTVIFDLPEPYAAAERLFDSIAILPRHLLERAYEDGTLGNAWGLNTARDLIAGLGPFRLKQYFPGQRIVLERNPFFWKIDGKRNQLPYLDEIICLSDISSEAEIMRFEAGETDIVSRIGAENFAILKGDENRRHFRMYDAGPGLEYTFLAFNLNDLGQGREPSITEKQEWFRQTAFRQAISNIIDRGAIVRLAYAGRAYPLLIPVSPGNRLWFDPATPRPVRSVERAKRLLSDAGFSWSADGYLSDARGRRVEFSIMHNAGRAQHVQMATIIQQDLKDIGIKVNLIPLDFATLVDRIFNSFAYEAAIVTLADGDSDPNSQMSVLLSHGAAHAWKLRSKSLPDDWQQEIDRLMQAQMTTVDHSKRKQMFDRVQQLVWRHEPVIFLVSPDILAGASDRVGNFQPAVLSSYTLWNADQLFIRKERGVAPH